MSHDIVFLRYYVPTIHHKTYRSVKIFIAARTYGWLCKMNYWLELQATIQLKMNLSDDVDFKSLIIIHNL